MQKKNPNNNNTLKYSRNLLNLMSSMEDAVRGNLGVRWSDAAKVVEKHQRGGWVSQGSGLSLLTRSSRRAGESVNDPRIQEEKHRSCSSCGTLQQLCHKGPGGSWESSHSVYMGCVDLEKGSARCSGPFSEKVYIASSESNPFRVEVGFCQGCSVASIVLTFRDNVFQCSQGTERIFSHGLRIPSFLFEDDVVLLTSLCLVYNVCAVCSTL